MCYDNDENLPVYEWGLVKGGKMHEIAEILLNKAKHTQVGTDVPNNVNRNTSFIVDTSCIGNIDDLKCDDLGIWHCTGVKTDFFRESGKKVKKVRSDKQAKVGVYKFTRRYYYNDNVNSLKKTMTIAADSNQVCYRYAFLQYMFTQGEQSVTARPHARNKINNKPYKRTKRSTLDKIKKDIHKHDSRKIVHNIIDERGGIEKVRLGSEIPRNRKQLYNVIQSVSKSEKISDPLQYLMQKCKEEIQDENTALIRSVQVIPEPIVFLSTKQELKDVERFCTNPEIFCVLGVDATFDLCDYYMTFVTYRNPILQTKNGNSPAIVGPGILHKSKLERSYYVLGAEMVRWHPPCSAVLALGTDGELNTVNALLRVFSRAVHLRCDLHMKDNILSKLTSLGISSAVSKEYMADIFGCGEEGGLVHSLSPSEFDDALSKIKATWETRHPKGADFIAYFLNQNASDIKGTMTVEVRSLCGLGFPADVYTQNASESMNRVLKEEDQDSTDLRRKKKTVCDIMERFTKVVKRQEQEQFLAVLGRGEYVIKDKFKYLEVGEDYFRMNDKQKAAVKKNFFNCSLNYENLCIVDEEPTAANKVSLSVHIDFCEIKTVPFLVLKEMYRDAANLVQSNGSVVKSPNYGDGSITANEIWVAALKRAPGKPHLVAVNDKTGRVCVRGLGTIQCLFPYTSSGRNPGKMVLQWFRNSKKSGSTTRMANVGMPKRSGQQEKSHPKA